LLKTRECTHDPSTGFDAKTGFDRSKSFLKETTLDRHLKPARHDAEKLRSICGRLFTGDYPYRHNIACMHTIFDKHGTAYAVAHRRLDDRAVVYTVHAGDHLELVARAVFDVTRGSVSEVLVWPGWHRRGVAAALYRLIEWERAEAVCPRPIGSVARQAIWASPGIDLSA